MNAYFIEDLRMVIVIKDKKYYVFTDNELIPLPNAVKDLETAVNVARQCDGFAKMLNEISMN